MDSDLVEEPVLLSSTEPSARSRHRVVIVGGGFAGLTAAQNLADPRVEVTLIDRRNFHLFQPLLYQVATGGLSPANIAAPLRSVLKRQGNATVLLDEVVHLDPGSGRVLTRGGELPFDSLIVATGATHSYFGNDQWSKFAPGLKSVEDATEIRRKVMSAFERAERSDDPAEIERLLTFVVIGGGPTGVELAGAIAELARHTLPDEFRRVDTATARVLLVDAAERILVGLPEDLSERAREHLADLGVAVRTGWFVTEVGPDHVTARLGEEEFVTLETESTFWAAGVTASPLGKEVAAATGAETDRPGRVKVAEDCSVPGHPNIYVVGDLARFEQAERGPLPGVAQVAMQQGKHVARQILRRIDGKATEPFRYHDYGVMAVIGRNAAVAAVFGRHLSGYLAWLAWLFVHLINLVGFDNQFMVLFQWGWNYLTRNRSARLITGEDDAEYRLP